MSNTILLKRSSVANAIPTLANVSLGELAINTYDGKLYTKINNGTDQIFELTKNQTVTLAGNVSGSGTDTITVSLNAVQTNITQVGTLASLSVTGAITGSNVVSVTGNVTGGNLITLGNAVVGGILTNNYYYANGAPVDFQQAAGNTTWIQYNNNGDFGASANFTFDAANSILSVNGNVNSGNVNTTTVSATTVSATGTVSGGNISTAGNVSANNVSITTSLNGNIISATGNITGANINTAGLISATGNVNSGNVNTGIVSATGNVNSGNVNTGIVSAASATLTGNVSSGNVNTGFVSVTGNVNSGNVNTTLVSATTVSATGTITGGDLSTAGNVSASGNISGNNISYTNSLTGSIISVSGNITSANLNTTTVSATTVSATGNVNGGNVNTSKLSTATGDLTITTGATDGNIYLFPTGTGNVILDPETYINNVKAPVQAYDAVNKQYVDNAVSTGITIHTPVDVESPDSDGSLNATYAQGGTTHTVTTISGNTTLTFSADHGLSVNDLIYWSTGFNGITANTAYFVYSIPANNQVTLSNAYGGGQINTLTNGTSLSQTGRANPGEGATLTSNVNEALVIDGVTLALGNRVLIYNQTLGYENGVYEVTDIGADDPAGSPWELTRASDMNTYMPDNINGLDAGDYFFVKSGDDGAGESYVMTAPVGPLIIGYNNLVFTQFSSSQVYSAGSGLTLTNTTFSVNVDNNTTAIVGGNVVVKAGANLTTPNIGSATGTSLSVTGNIVGGNLITNGVLETTGNLAANNITVTNNLGTNTLNANTATVVGNVSTGNISTTLLSATTASVTGNISGNNVSIANIAAVGSLRTDNYQYANGAPVDFQQPAGANTEVQFNLNNDFGASANFTYNSATGVLSVTGNINSGNVNTTTAAATTVTAVGNVTGGNITTAGIGNIATLDVTTLANIKATTAATSTTSGALRVAGGAGIGGNIYVGGLASITGNVTGGNISTAGLVTATGNITGGNLTTAGIGNIATLEVTAFANIKATTAATSTTSGALRVAGGLGVVGNIYGGLVYSDGNLVLNTESTVDGGTY
jgi:hypothetical protein